MECGYYAVVVVHSFEEDTPLYLFTDYEKAKRYLENLWEDYYNEEIANGSDLDEALCYHEDEYAKVTWSDGCRTEFILTYSSKPEEI